MGIWFLPIVADSLLCAFLHANQLVLPELLKLFRPLVHWLDRRGIRLVKLVPALAAHSHQAYFSQDPQVL